MNLSDELLHEVQRLLYHEWSVSFDTLKNVKKDKNDGSPDWELFHQEQLKNAIEREAFLSRLLKELNPHCPLTRGM